MHSAKPISQDVLFYYGKWTRSVESLVLGKFEYKRWQGSWIPGPSVNNRHLVFDVKLAMQNELKINIQLAEYFMKVQEWEDRYHQFVWLINQPNVVYDCAKNVVDASKATWDTIAGVRPEMCVYMEEGEFNFARLRVLFEEVVEHSESRQRLSMPSNSGASLFSEVVDQPNASAQKSPNNSLSTSF